MDIFQDEILFPIGVILAIFIIGLVIITLISFCFPENKRHSSYINKNKGTIRPNTKRYEDYRPSSKPQGSLEKEREDVYNNQPFRSELSFDEKNDLPNDKSENIILSKDLSENEKTSQIQQSLNVDGTVRTEIQFDSTIEDSAAIPFSPKFEYLETANNGRFRKLLPTNEKSFFRTWVENGTRFFEFYGNVEKALANINAIFDDVCEIEGKQNGATQIINEKPGVLDSHLSIEKKAIIKLI